MDFKKAGRAFYQTIYKQVHQYFMFD